MSRKESLLITFVLAAFSSLPQLIKVPFPTHTHRGPHIPNCSIFILPTFKSILMHTNVLKPNRKTKEKYACTGWYGFFGIHRRISLLLPYCAMVCTGVLQYYSMYCTVHIQYYQYQPVSHIHSTHNHSSCLTVSALRTVVSYLPYCVCTTCTYSYYCTVNS